NILKRFREHAAHGLVDGRSQRRVRARAKMTSDVEHVVMSAWFSYPAAGHKAVWRKALEECDRLGLPLPGYHSVLNFLNRQPRDLKLLRAGNLETLNKEHKPVVRFTMSSRANERFQIDHSRLDIWVKDQVASDWL